VRRVPVTGVEKPPQDLLSLSPGSNNMRNGGKLHFGIIEVLRGLSGLNLVERLFPWCPATWSELLGLKRLKNTDNLINISSDREIVYGNPSNCSGWIYDVGGSEADPSVLVEDAEICRKFSLQVCEHREGKFVEPFVVLAPCKM
jgi:hypothetical protein